MIKKFEQYNFKEEIEEIDYSDFDISGVSDKDMFDYIYSYSPKTLQDNIDSLKNIDQRRDYHPEGDVYTHTKVVTNRLAKTKDIDLIISAFLHDTGKDRTTTLRDGIISQPGHENYSAELMNIGSPWREWVRKLGANPEVIRFIVSNHMKMKILKGNNKLQRWYDNLGDKLQKYLNAFNKEDRGGF